MTIVRLRPSGGSRTSVVPIEGSQARALRRQRRLAALGAILGLTVGVIAFLPASLLADAVDHASNDQFVLAEAEGTVWSGSALPVITGGRGRDGQPSRDASVLPSRLVWRLSPRWNGVSLHLSQDCCLAHGVDVGVRRALGAWQVRVLGPSEGDAAAPSAMAPAAAPTRGTAAADAVAMQTATPLGQWPMGWIEGRGFPWNTIRPGGLLTLTTHDLSFSLKNGHWSTRGSAQLEIRQASSRLTTLPTLGSYRVLIQADPSTQTAPDSGATRALVWISTLEGALQIDGRGLIGAHGARLRAQAQAAPGSEAALNNLLNLIGRRNGALSVISIG